jgi:hypothetical protein
MATLTKQKFRRKRREILLPNDELEVFRSQSVINRRILVINRNYQPITTCTLRSAINKLVKELAVIVLPPGEQSGMWRELDWSDWEDMEPRPGETVLQAAKRAFKIPEIIKTLDYADQPHRHVKLSRRSIFKRDDYTCQYCGKRAPEDLSCEELTLDHVIPKSQGGKMVFENVLLACTKCNRKKDARTPAEAHMTPLSIPRVPEYDVLQGRTIRVDSWQHFLGDCYWEVPLKD